MCRLFYLLYYVADTCWMNGNCCGICGKFDVTRHLFQDWLQESSPEQHLINVVAINYFFTGNQINLKEQDAES